VTAARWALGAALGLALLPRTATAQVVNPGAKPLDAPNLVALGAGLDSGAALEAAYARRVPGHAARPDLFVLGRLLLPSSPGLGDFAFATGAQTAWLSSHGFGLQPGLALEVRRVEATLLRMTQLAAVASLAAGYFSSRWMVALEASWDRSFATHVAPTATYRRLAYPGAEGGFVAGGGGTLRLGVRAALGVTSTTDVTVRIGLATSDRLTPVAGLPLYGLLGVTQRF